MRVRLGTVMQNATPSRRPPVMMPDDAFTCPVCLDIFVDPCTAVPCGHSACAHCINNWLDRGNTRCPSCTITITHVVLSYALRAATESEHGPAVARRRAAQQLPRCMQFSRVIAVPFTRYITASPILIAVVFVAACIGIQVFRSYEADAFLGITLLSAVGLAVLIQRIGTQEVLEAVHNAVRAPPPRMGEQHERLRGGPAELLLAGVAALAGLGPLPEPPPPQQQAAGHVRRIDPMRSLLAAWFVLFALFFIVLHRQIWWFINEQGAADGGTHLTAVAAAVPLLPMRQMLVQVFVVTFSVVFVTLVGLHVARHAADQFRQ